MKPYSKSRCKYHDYREPCIYLLTLCKAPGIPAFSRIEDCGDTAVPYSQIHYTTSGTAILAALRGLPADFPIQLLQYVVMPDHLHVVLRVKARMEKPLGAMMREFTSRCTLTYGNRLFEPGFHDRILLRKGQLDRMIRYVADNPRRLLIKRRLPGLFTSSHAVAINCREYATFGNFLLLRHPVMAWVKYSSADNDKTRKAKDRLWREAVRQRGVLVSPFIHPTEKEYLQFAMENGAGVILLRLEAFPHRFKPSGSLFELCAEGRLLIISQGAPPGSPLTRADAEALNRLASLITDPSIPLSLTRRP